MYPINPKANPRHPTIGKSEILERQRHAWGESTNKQNIILIPLIHPTNPRNPKQENFGLLQWQGRGQVNKCNTSSDCKKKVHVG